jgi:hypothetical protein
MKSGVSLTRREFVAGTAALPCLASARMACSRTAGLASPSRGTKSVGLSDAQASLRPRGSSTFAMPLQRTR